MIQQWDRGTWTLYEAALAKARGLKSEDDENPEYDRALVELVADLFSNGEDMDHATQRVLNDLNR